MYCIHCGKKSDSSDKFCGSCGGQLSQTLQKDTQNTSPEESNHIVQDKSNTVVSVQGLEIRDRSELTADQIQYISKPSITFFGPAALIARRLGGALLIAVLFRGVDSAIANMDDSDASILMALLSLAGYIWFVVVGVRNNRRWSWNANKWKDYSSFQNSERNWMFWGVLGVVIAVLVTIGGFFGTT